jgi:hypothetical protein
MQGGDIVGIFFACLFGCAFLCGCACCVVRTFNDWADGRRKKVVRRDIVSNNDATSKEINPLLKMDSVSSAINVKQDI